MSGLEFGDEQELRDAIADVRSDSTDTDCYEGPKSQKIVLVGKGNGGVNELVEHLKEDIVGYALVRKTEKIDESVTVKFAYIFWLGENTPRMQKARVTVHQGGVRTFIGQFHVDITASNKDEISSEIIQTKIMETSGTASRVMDSATGTREQRSFTGGSITRGAKASTGLEFVNEEEVRATFKELRTAGEDGIDWLLMSYDPEDFSKIVLIGQGTGGAAELVEHLNDGIVGYGLVRKVEQIDDTKATKFAFVKFQGDDIPRMLKARIGTHAGKVTEFFSVRLTGTSLTGKPYHVNLDVTHMNEISDEIIMTTIKIASGTKVHVLADEHTQRTTPVTKGSSTTSLSPRSSNVNKIPAVPKTSGQTQVIKFTDEEAVRNGIKAVRSDTDPTDWCLVGYEGKKGNTLTLLGTGSGGLAELVPLLEDDMVGYGLVRKTDQIDDSVTVKFVFVTFTGEKINRMHRARLGTYSGAVSELFSVFLLLDIYSQPYHVDFQAETIPELTAEAIMEKVQFASGTRSHVKG